MTYITAFPYLRPSSSRILNTEWLQLTDFDEQPLSELFPHWDPGISLRVRVTTQVDIEGIWKDCHLSSDDMVRLVLIWYSQGTGLRGSGGFIDIYKSLPGRSISLDLTVEGTLLAGNVHFGLQLVLARPGKKPFMLAPQRPGSILWHEEKVVILEGQGTRFPSELINFATTQWLPSDAAWFLDWDPEALDEMILGSLRLFLNMGNELIRRAAIESLQIDQSVRDMIRFDVGRAMITAALNNEEFIQSTEDTYPDGSIGASIRRLLHALFPTESIEALAHRCQYSISRFNCELQDRFRLFKEV